MPPTDVETLVEPLVLADDCTSSRELLTIAVSPSPMANKLRSKPTGMNFDEEDEEEHETKRDHADPETRTAHPPPSPRVADPRVDSQNPLVLDSPMEPAPSSPQLEIVEIKDEPVVETSPASNHEPDPIARGDTAVTDPAVEIPAFATIEPKPPTKEDVATLLATVQAFLFDKVKDNQCSTHSKEIHDFLTTHLSESQQAELLPLVIDRLAHQFQTEMPDQDVSLDVQSSLCLLEQMFVPIGRRSPLQDMYTAEEEELLNQLGKNSAR